MIKLWAKVIKDDKIRKDMIYQRWGKFDPADFRTYLVEICYDFDIPTPVVLKSHKFNFRKFNVAKFRESDFVETVDFDALVIENASENQ